jgi:hypothetical protein
VILSTQKILSKKSHFWYTKEKLLTTKKPFSIRMISLQKKNVLFVQTGISEGFKKLFGKGKFRVRQKKWTSRTNRSVYLFSF